MPTTSLCTVADVRARLELPPNAVRDAVLDAVRSALESKVLDVTGFTFTGGQKTDQLTNVQLGVVRYTKLRPILPLSAEPGREVVIQARSLASGTFSDVLGDLQDPYEGKVLPLASELTPVYPPAGGSAPWFRWRQMIWPVVRLTYLVDPLGSGTNPVPDQLKQAVVEWAAYVWSRPGAGALSSFTAERVSETYAAIERPMPQLAAMLLSRYTRERASLVF